MNTGSNQERVRPLAGLSPSLAEVVTHQGGLGIFWMGLEEDRLHANACLLALLGLPRDGSGELSLADFLQQFAPSEHERLTLEIDMVKRGEQVIDRAVLLERDDKRGQKAYLSVRAERVERDQESLILGSCRDCSKEMQLAVRARESSIIDADSGLFNRAYFDQQLHREWRISLRERHGLALVMVQIDLMKRYVQRVGEQAGEALVAKLATLVKQVLARPADLSARFADDRIVMLLPRTDAAGALHLSQRLHAEFHAQIVKAAQHEEIAELGLSIGVGYLSPSATAMGHEVLISRAQAACYAAMSRGGDQVEMWQESMPEAPQWG